MVLKVSMKRQQKTPSTLQQRYYPLSEQNTFDRQNSSCYLSTQKQTRYGSDHRSYYLGCNSRYIRQDIPSSAEMKTRTRTSWLRHVSPLKVPNTTTSSYSGWYSNCLGRYLPAHNTFVFHGCMLRSPASPPVGPTRASRQPLQVQE